MNSRDGWRRVKLGDVVRNVSDSVGDPVDAGLERAVGLEHLDPGELAITRWASTSDGLTFTRRFRAGQVLYGRRRVYQRKAAVPEFDGVCSGDIYVLEPNNDALLPELLPFIVQSEPFHEYALRTSAGSLSPRTKWTDLRNYEFGLPPIDEQREIAEVLWATEQLSLAYVASVAGQAAAAQTYMQTRLTDERMTVRLGDVIDDARPLCYGVVQPGRAADDGVPLIRVCDIEGDSLDTSALRTISRSVHEQYQRSVVRPGDVLVSVVGTIGRTVVVPEEADGFNIARAVARIAPGISQMTPEFLVAVLRTRSYQTKLIAAGFESARRTLNLSSLANIEIPLPSLSVQQEILSSSTDWRRAVDRTRDQQMRLKRVRKDVLRHLMR